MSATTYTPEQKEQIARAVNKWFKAYSSSYPFEEDTDFKNELDEIYPELSFTFDPSSRSWLIP